MLVYHATGLCLDCDSSFSFNIQFIKDLLIATWRNRARQLEQPITKRALSMIDMCYYTKVSEPFDWNGLYAALKLCYRLLSLSASCYRCAEGSCLFEELRHILRSYGAREPEDLQWASLHLSA